MGRDGARGGGGSRCPAEAADTKTARKRAVTRAVKEVAHYLGNTPAVAARRYIDPRVFDPYKDGLTIGGGARSSWPTTRDDTAIQGPVEEAVIDLIEGHEGRAIVPAEEIV